MWRSVLTAAAAAGTVLTLGLPMASAQAATAPLPPSMARTVAQSPWKLIGVGQFRAGGECIWPKRNAIRPSEAVTRQVCKPYMGWDYYQAGRRTALRIPFTPYFFGLRWHNYRGGEVLLNGNKKVNLKFTFLSGVAAALGSQVMKFDHQLRKDVIVTWHHTGQQLTVARRTRKPNQLVTLPQPGAGKVSNAAAKPNSSTAVWVGQGKPPWDSWEFISQHVLNTGPAKRGFCVWMLGGGPFGRIRCLDHYMVITYRTTEGELAFRIAGTPYFIGVHLLKGERGTVSVVDSRKRNALRHAFFRSRGFGLTDLEVVSNDRPAVYLTWGSLNKPLTVHPLFGKKRHRRQVFDVAASTAA